MAGRRRSRLDARLRRNALGAQGALAMIAALAIVVIAIERRLESRKA
jgi:hypothetical protein